MRLNITFGGEPVNGFLNVDPYFDHDGKTKCAIDNIDCVDNNECEEIIALDVLEYIPVQLADKTIDHWVSKLAHGGKLTVNATNIRQVARSVINKSVNLDELNEYIYGSQRFDWEIKRGMVDLDRLCGAMISKGLKIVSKRLDGLKMFVTAERP